MSDETKYPEHEKLRAVHDQTLLLSEFYDWLESNGYHLARFHGHTHSCYEESGSDGPGRPDADGLRWHSGDRMCGLRTDVLYSYGVPPPSQLFGLYFDIDPKKLSAEKDAMYEELRATNRAA
jgi:hypothetical protein